jgi:hypothetical protein
LAVAVYLARYAAVPQRLPGVALGSRELLIAQRESVRKCATLGSSSALSRSARRALAATSHARRIPSPQ